MKRKRKANFFALQNYTSQVLRHLLFISLILLSGMQAYAQSSSVTVRGVITSATDRLPLIGVNIVEKGTTNGTITDFDGHFELAVPAGATLVASYIGYLDEEVKVIPGNTFYQVVMKENSLALDEVVVVGYGVQKKKLVTGATVQVKGDDIQKLNTVSPLSALQSQTPGVNIVKKSGQPGEGFKVNIRGIGTIGNSQPLYIVDGVARGDIDYLNPADIESLDVLKDAASAAIYGSRAANGVVLVTTKQGKAGKASIEYDGYFGVQNPYRMTPVLNAQEYAIIMDEAKVNSGLPLNDYASLLAPGDWERIQNGTWQGTNWLEEIRKKNAPIQSHSLNMSGGGTEQSVYSIGLSYTSQEGIFGKPVTPEYTRYTARVNTEHTLYKVKDLNVIQFGENLSYTYTEKSGIAIGNEYWNDINSALRATPFLPLWARDADGNDIPGQYHYVIPWNTQMPNPVGIMDYERGQNASKNHNIYGNFYFVIQPIKDLKFRSNFGFNASAWSYRAYKPEFDLGPISMNPEDEVRQNSGNGLGWTFENTLSYTFKINTDHTFDALIGTSAERWGLGESMSGKNVNSVFGDFNHAFLDNTALLDIAKIELGGGPGGRGGILSYFGRINYNYQEKYMGTVVFRADGSSNFAKGNRWGYFPSVSAGWVMSNEEFMETTREWMDFLKLRASWGQNGNQSIDAFQYLATISFKESEYFIGAKDNKVVGAYPDILPNPDVTWETSEQIDLGVDARFLNSRLSLAFDWYKKTTRDWLVPAPILASYGTGAPYINGGDVVNKGIELSLNWNDRVEDFTYSVTANLSHNKNEITRIANNEGIIRSEVNLNYGEEGFPRAQVGYPISYFWGYKTDGIFQNYEEIQNYKNADGQVIMPTAEPGDVKFADLNGDGVIDDKDKTNIGDPNPDIIFGLNFNFGYKGFDLNITTNGVLGNQIFYNFHGNPTENYSTEILGRWHGEGTSNKIPRVTDGSHINRRYMSDLYIYNGDYWRISNVTLGYDFNRLLKKSPFAQLRLYVTAQNLFTFTKYPGMDPEIGTSTDDEKAGWVSGIDVGFYPTPRTYMIGANIKF